MFWTTIMFPKFLILLAFAGAGMWYSDQSGQSYHWTVPAVYMMTGIIFLMIGLAVDLWDKGRQPQKMTVLLRHQNQAWFLTVMRSPNGELYAPGNKDLRRLIPAGSMADIPHNILGCPKFTPVYYADWPDRPQGFSVLGAMYKP